MKFSSKFAVAAILFAQSATLGSNFVEANDDAANLRGGSAENEISENGERELTPFGWGNGFGYSTNNNRFSVSRTRGGRIQGHQRLRPVRNGPFQPYMSGGGILAGKSAKGKSTKYYNGKASKATGPAVVRNKAAKYDKSFKSTKTSYTSPHRGSYINAMQWQRVPGQPIFVSQTETPIVVFETEPNIAFDGDGNPVLVDENGNEIIINVDENGNQVVETLSALTDLTIYVCSENCEQILDDINDPTFLGQLGSQASVTIGGGATCGGACTPGRRKLQSDSDFQVTMITIQASELSEDEILALAKSTLPGTTSVTAPAPDLDTNDDTPSDGSTAEPTLKPTQNPTRPPTRNPTKAPTKPATPEPTRNPTRKPTREPTRKPTRNPTRNPTRKPTDAAQ